MSHTTQKAKPCFASGDPKKIISYGQYALAFEVWLLVFPDHKVVVFDPSFSEEMQVNNDHITYNLTREGIVSFEKNHAFTAIERPWATITHKQRDQLSAIFKMLM